MNIDLWKIKSFKKHVVNVHHAKHDLDFNVHYHPLWDWAMDVLQDPHLQPHFVWDAQCLYKHNGEHFECFIEEPWTGDRWWNIQSSLLQEDAAPFTFILYMDKSHLSSLGKVKAYPIIVPEDSANDRKLSYTNLKRVVWHQAFLKLLNTITCLSKVGFAYKTHDARAGDLSRLFSNHLFVELKKILATIGHHAKKTVDTHYLHYHMYILLDIHMETTLAAGECELCTFQCHLEEYIAMHDPEAMQKNWNFPKVHLGKHAFMDICEKGAA
ncbi:hypothetical protein EDC04DRAFT_2614050 [Pisolithus marmoratus]|nr:hypothetical protein EDC04DRAFT_2614050 [Pisolithus marmoratus]